jgi:glycosyltransferase involved in cell wall biosynthesis
VSGAIPRMPSGRIRVAQVVTRFIAGAGGVALRGAIGLDPARFESTIVTAPGGSLIEQASAADLEVLTLRHMRHDIAPTDALAGVRELRALFDLGRFDVVHTHSAKAGALGRIAAHQAQVPAVVHTFHGFPFHAFQSPLRRGAYIAAERRLGRITDRFVAVCSTMAAEAVRLGIAPAERVCVIPVSIADRSVGRDASTRAHARRLLGIPDDVLLVGTVGRIDYQKAPGHFLEALVRLGRGVHGVWIGDGPLAAEVEAQGRALGLGSRLHLAGERDDVPALLPGLDVFVMTSLYEGLPCALVEAMQCGLPVVATAVNGVPEIVFDNVTGLLVPPARPQACAAALGYLLDHPDSAQRLADAGRRAVAGRFEAGASAATLGRVYEAALGALPDRLALLPEAS